MTDRDKQRLQLLLDETNQTIVSLLRDSACAVTLDVLAEHILSEDVLAVRSSDYEKRFEETVVSLHHSRLPQLDEAGLIEYDTEENIASHGEYASVDTEWQEIEEIDELLSRFRTGSTHMEDSIGVLEGREDIYKHGRELADRAENELFLIYTSDELLHEDCLPHAENAIERGVTFAAGAKNEGTRQFFHECLPEATVWEPQMDWMNDQSGFPKISRLIFADREKVVIGLWKHTESDDSKQEVAMIGEGPRNPLVVLVRELLGPRLDHLDYQSENFMQDLPFEA